MHNRYYKKWLLKINYPFIFQFIKYCAIGVINTLVSYVFFWLFYYLFLLQSVSLFLANLIGVLVSYFLNSKYNFKKKVTRIRYICFVIVLLLLSYTIGYLGDLYFYFPLLTFVISIFITLPIGFLFSKYIIFQK